MVEVEFIHTGKRKEDEPVNGKKQWRFPLFKKVVYAQAAGRVDARWIEIADAGFLMCIVHFDLNPEAIIRIRAKQDMAVVPVLLDGELRVETEEKMKFELIPLEYYLLTVREKDYLSVINKGMHGCMVLFVLRDAYFKGLPAFYRTAQEVLSKTYIPRRTSFLMMDPHMQHLLRYIFSIVSGGAKTDHFRLAMAVRTLIAIALAGIDRAPGTLSPPPVYMEWQISNVQKIKDYLWEHYETFPGIDSLTRMAHMNQVTLRKVFTALTGCKMYEYWDKHRMELAREWLAQKKHKPTHIAFILGFASSQAFSKQFKKHFSVPPSRIYRRPY